MRIAPSITAPVAAFALCAASLTAQAHTTSLGYVPGVNPGEVTFWSGSYEHGSTPENEGIVRLTGVDVSFDATASFNIGPVSVRPTGLVDGSNNFFWGPYDGSIGRYPFPLSTDPVLFGGVVYWQGVTFTGLKAGVYDFGCGSSCGVTQQWDSLNGDGDIVRLTLTGSDVGGGGPSPVPEPETYALMLAGLGVLGAVARRKQAQKTA